MGLSELRWRKIDEPLPATVRRGRTAKRRSEVFAMLDTMAVGDVVEVEQARASLETYVYRFRLERGRELRFKIRMTDRLGWCKCWRVA